MKKSELFLLFSIVVIIIFTACSADSIKTSDSTITKLNMPDQIIIYKDGHKKMISKNDRLYNKILELSESRLPAKFDTPQSAINTSDLNNSLKSFSIEFFYSNEQAFNYKGINQNFKYSKIVFPLTEQYNKFIIFYNSTNNPIEILGSLKNCEELLNLLE